MAIYNPWRGCHRCSEGCKYCYIFKGDSKKGIDTNQVVKSPKFYEPIERLKNGEYKIKANSIVYVCFSSDFLISEADNWRGECFAMFKQRTDLHFIFLTKRIERLEQCLPADWQDGYDNVTIGVSVENQVNADKRLAILADALIKHKNIIIQPMLEAINIRPYLKDIELVIVGGEADKNGRILDYDWVLDIRQQCIEANVSFEFRQCATNFVKDNVLYHLNTSQLMSQAKKANINYQKINKEGKFDD